MEARIQGAGPLGTEGHPVAFVSVAPGANVSSLTSARVQGAGPLGTEGDPIGAVILGTGGVAFTPGSVIFVGAGGQLSEDNANFRYVDADNALILAGTPPASATKTLLELGSAISGGSAAGTFLGINAGSGFTGDLARWQLNGANRLSVDHKGRIVGTGDLGNNEVGMELQPSAVGSNSVGYKLTIPGTPTAPIQVFYGVGSVEHNIEAKLENQNTSVTYANAKFEMRTFAAGGDPFMHFAVQGGTEWAAGVDNDWSDRFTVAANSVLGSGQLFVIQTDGDTMVGHGGTAVARLDVQKTTALTNSVQGMLYLGHASSNTPAAGFGGRLRFGLESSTTADREALDLDVTWATATDASRAARAVFNLYDFGAARECLRLEASGSAPMIGFLGAAASARISVTGSRGGNAALASLLSALATFGLITDNTTA